MALDLVGAGLVAVQAPADDRLALLDQGPIPCAAVLLGEQGQGAVGPRARRAAGLGQQQQRQQPGTSGSSGMSAARIRASRIASGHRPGPAGLASPAV
jgi:hypothetical protein